MVRGRRWGGGKSRKCTVGVMLLVLRLDLRGQIGLGVGSGLVIGVKVGVSIGEEIEVGVGKGVMVGSRTGVGPRGRGLFSSSRKRPLSPFASKGERWKKMWKLCQ